MKELDGMSNKAVDEVMQMTGLESVKRQFLNVLQKLQTSQRQGIDIQQERLGTVFLGNPGTGKTTVARLYAKFLAEVGALPGSKFVETTGAKIANEGVAGTKKMLASVLEAGGGAIFVDEAYQLVSGSSWGGSAVLDFLLAEIENTTGKVVFMFAGYEKQMEKFFQYNPGLISRMPCQLKFADYTESELLHMLQQKIKKRFKGKMNMAGGPQGLYMRIVVRRLHRGSGKEGFGNARALENVLDRITTRQSGRLTQFRRSGSKPNDFHLTKEDLIGPAPSGQLAASSAWKKLQGMIGPDAVKQSVQILLNRLQENYQRELKEQPPIEVSLNKLFVGSPGTGKTTVAKLYGEILAELGVLSTSECVVKTPADFIGSVMGESEENTKSILESTKGKVLVIDEAHMLCSNLGDASISAADPYRKAVVDTIVSEIHSVPGEDRAILLLGYQEQMEDMLRKVNPGLTRRFPMESAFFFEDYNDDQLLSILNRKLTSQGLSASDEAKKTAIGVLSKLRRRRNFGNAGEVENLLSRAKDSFSVRQQKLPIDQRSSESILEPQDFDADFGRGDNAIENCRALFEDVVGADDVVGKLEGYIRTFENAEAAGLNPEDMIPFNFVFKGPPGTGKTTTARKIGRVFYDMGFLSEDAVVECSATDLIGQFVGHTGPKVIQKLDEALGKVLFIDEAYRLGDGQFGKEATDELVDCLTKKQYKNKMIVVLAGYEDEINRLLAVNPGLSSRFAEEIFFPNLGPDMCVKLLVQKIQKKEKFKWEPCDSAALQKEVEGTFEALAGLPGWGNGRDIETLATRVISTVLTTCRPVDDSFRITWSLVMPQLEHLHSERKARAACQPQSGDLTEALSGLKLATQSQQRQPSVLRQEKSIDTASPAQAPHAEEEKGPASTSTEGQRDAGVSDQIWQQLQVDSECQKRAEYLAATTLASCQHQQALHAQEAEQASKLAAELEAQAQIDDEAKRRHEAMRLKALEARRKADAEAERQRQILHEKQREAKAQQKLREMGVCPVGFQWIKQAEGYRCAGGSHFVEDGEIGL